MVSVPIATSYVQADPAREVDDATQATAVARGATKVVNEAAILSHLPQLLGRALEIQ